MSNISTYDELVAAFLVLLQYDVKHPADGEPSDMLERRVFRWIVFNSLTTKLEIIKSRPEIAWNDIRVPRNRFVDKEPDAVNTTLDMVIDQALYTYLMNDEVLKQGFDKLLTETQEETT